MATTLKTRTSKKHVARRLRKLGLTWNTITWALYGHTGTQAFYTAKGRK